MRECSGFFSAERLLTDSPVPKYLQAAEIFRHFIFSPEGNREKKFPPEPELARMLQCSRRTVREAMNTLEKEHLVCRIPRRGTVFASTVSPRDRQSGVQKICVVWPRYNSTWTPLLQEFRECAEDAGYQVEIKLYHLTDRVEEQRLLLNAFRESRGVVFYPNLCHSDENLIRDIPEYFPLVLFDLPSKTVRFSSVSVDHESGAYLLTQKLLETGFRRPGFVGTSNIPSSELRFRGYRNALEDAGIPFEPAMNYSVRKGFNNPDFLNWLTEARIDSLVLVSPALPNNFFLYHRDIISGLHGLRTGIAGFELRQKEIWKDPAVLFCAEQPGIEMGRELFRILEYEMRSTEKIRLKTSVSPKIYKKN